MRTVAPSATRAASRPSATQPSRLRTKRLRGRRKLWDDGYDDLDLYVYDPFFVRQPFYYSYGFGSGLNRFYATPWWLSVPTRGPEQSGANSGDVQSSPSQAVTAPAPADAESSEPDAAPQRRANPRKRFGLATTQKVQPVPDKVVRSGSASGAQHSGAGSGSVKQRKGGAPSSSAQPKPASKKRRPTARKRLR